MNSSSTLATKITKQYYQRNRLDRNSHHYQLKDFIQTIPIIILNIYVVVFPGIWHQKMMHFSPLHSFSPILKNSSDPPSIPYKYEAVLRLSILAFYHYLSNWRTTLDILFRFSLISRKDLPTSCQCTMRHFRLPPISSPPFYLPASPQQLTHRNSHPFSHFL